MNTLQKQWFISALFLPLLAASQAHAAQAPGGPHVDPDPLQLPSQSPHMTWSALCQTAHAVADTTSDYASTALGATLKPTTILIAKSWNFTHNIYGDYVRWTRRCEAEIARKANKDKPIGAYIHSEIPQGCTEPVYYMTLIYPGQVPPQR